MPTSAIKALFLDIGGVLLTNGWDRNMRKRAAETFALDYAEMDERHHLTFDTYEEGKLSLDEYLQRVVFYEQRPFTPDAFKQFMLAQSQPYPEMIELVKTLKARYSLKIATVSNEGRELTLYRLHQFKLTDFVDFFVSSCFVHYRKPDADIYRIALDIGQIEPNAIVYVDDRPLFVDIANSLGMHGLHHKDYAATKQALTKWGLAE
ncbi:MAG: HAD family phosphatase [Caldilineaceae bacterium]